MSHQVETMAYAGEVPWHGLGVPVADSLTPEEMLVAAGLDWTVSKRDIFYLDNQGEFQDTKDFSIIVRDSDETVLSPCGRNYVPTQNRQVFEFFDKFVKAGNMTMGTAGSLNNGRQVWGLANIKKGFTLPGGDEVQGHLLISHPHQWGKSLTVMFTPVRVVCNNTLTMALGQAGDRFRMTHVREFDFEVQEEAMRALGMASEQLNQFEQAATLLTKVQYDEKQLNEYISRLFQPKVITEELEELSKVSTEVHRCIHTQPGAELSEGSWWSALNAVTYYVDHKAGRDRNSSLSSAWFGPRAATKRQALNLAMEYAEAA